MKVFLILALLSTHISVEAEEPKFIYLLAKFKSSKFMENKSHKTKDGKIILVPSTLSMTFEVLKEIQSESGFNKETIILPLDVESDYPFRVAEEVVLVLQKNKLNNYELLDWDFVKSAICLEKSLIAEEHSENYFDVPWMTDKKRRCRFIRKRY